MSVRRALEHARSVNESVYVLTRTHSDDDRAYLEKRGADEAVVGELELALELGRRALVQFGVSPDIVEQSVTGMRKSAD